MVIIFAFEIELPFSTHPLLSRDLSRKKFNKDRCLEINKGLDVDKFTVATGSTLYFYELNPFSANQSKVLVKEPIKTAMVELGNKL